MIVSKPKNFDPLLFAQGSDRTFSSMAQTRNYVGEFFERLTENLTGALRMKTDCNADICPDLKFNDDQFFECKAIGKSGAVIVYTLRVENDAKFVSTGRRLHYWLWNHSASPGKTKTLYELHAELAVSVRNLCIIDFDSLHAIIKSFPEKILNPKKQCPKGERSGYGAERYKVGYSVRLSAISETLNTTKSMIQSHAFGRAVSIPIIRAADATKFNFIFRDTLWNQRTH